MTTDASTDQPSAMVNAAANGMKAARAFPCRYRKGNSTTAVVSVAPMTAGVMRAATSARASAVSGTVPNRSATTRPFCTRMPIPIARPASVSMLAGMSKT